MKARDWAVATMLIEDAPPSVVVAFLRLLLPCAQCGARPMQGCIRGLGEVDATHLTRGN